MDELLPLFHDAWRGPAIQQHAVDRAAVIGDIHGRDDLLIPLLEQIGDRPIFVAGDIVDRGIGVPRCVEALIAAEARGVLGNHDLWFARWASGEGFDSHCLSPRMGGAATLSGYQAHPRDHHRVPREHVAWFNGLALVVDLVVAGVPYWLVHAGVSSDRDLTGCTPETVITHLAEHHPADLLWRKNPPESMLALDRRIIMGHCPRHEPVVNEAVIAIDTGAGAGLGRLTAVLLPEETFLHVVA